MAKTRFVVVTPEVLRAALIDWHAHYTAMPGPQRENRRSETEGASPIEFAEATVGYVFSLLEKHGTPGAG
jgi:hypothetical protein